MKKLLILLFSILFLSSHSVFAEDLSDFQIEGMSIGDSLLDYMTEDEILEGIEITKNHYLYLKEPHKYAEVYLWKDFLIYEDISVFFKNNSSSKYITNKNEKYTILFIRGMIEYIEDFEDCIQKRDEIVEELSEMFPNAQKDKYFGSHLLDPSGDSIIDSVSFKFDSGAEIESQCNNWEEIFRIKNKYTEGLSVAIYSKEIASWFQD